MERNENFNTWISHNMAKRTGTNFELNMENYPGFINRVCKRIARELKTLEILNTNNKIKEVLKQMKIRIALKDYILKQDKD